MILTAQIFYSKKIQSRISKGKRHKKAYRMKTREKEAQTSKSPLPVKSHRMYLIPSNKRDNTGELSARETYSELSAQGVYWGLIV